MRKALVTLKHVECDEMWTFVAKKQAALGSNTATAAYKPAALPLGHRAKTARGFDPRSCRSQGAWQMGPFSRERVLHPGSGLLIFEINDDLVFAELRCLLDARRLDVGVAAWNGDVGGHVAAVLQGFGLDGDQHVAQGYVVDDEGAVLIDDAIGLSHRVAGQFEMHAAALEWRAVKFDDALGERAVGRLLLTRATGQPNDGDEQHSES